jgi:RNA polymerase sigma-70 factor (ECF subfamily)
MLLQRIAQGDESAVPACLAEYGVLVWALARRYATDPADAEDAAQEVFIELWRHAARFDPAVAGEATFVATVARRRLLDRARKRGRSVKTAPLPPDGGAAAAPDRDTIGVSDEAALVRTHLERISPDQRTVLELAIDRGLSQTQIAEATGMPLGTVKAHARRGLLRLRELLGCSVQPLGKGGRHE